jgi:chromosome segregation ATPase
MSDADFLWKLIAAVSTVGGLVLLVLKIRGGGELRTINPQPLIIKLAEQFASKEELLRLEESVKSVERRISDMPRELNHVVEVIDSKLENKLDKIQHRMETVGTTLSELSRAIGRLEGNHAAETATPPRRRNAS